MVSSGKKDYGTSEQYEMPGEIVARYEVVGVPARAGDAVLFHLDLFQ